MTKDITLVYSPTISILAEQQLNAGGVLAMAEWVRSHRPDCVPEDGFSDIWDLLPHDQLDSPHGQNLRGENVQSWIDNGTRLALTDNEVLCEIAGRTCYHSFAEKAGKKTNKDYFEHIFSMDPLHSSILYHAKMTFFFGGVSRKFSHQFIRNYVGSDRDEEGSPSQESTRFTHHYGHYIVPPYILEDAAQVEYFRDFCQKNYASYCTFLEQAAIAYTDKHGVRPTGGARKDIYEAGAGYLNMSAETSFVWTTNPVAIRKFLKERLHEAADAEIQRFALELARICLSRWPNLFIGKDLDEVRKRVAETPVSL